MDRQEEMRKLMKLRRILTNIKSDIRNGSYFISLPSYENEIGLIDYPIVFGYSAIKVTLEKCERRRVPFTAAVSPINSLLEIVDDRINEF